MVRVLRASLACLSGFSPVITFLTFEPPLPSQGFTHRQRGEGVGHIFCETNYYYPSIVNIVKSVF